MSHGHVVLERTWGRHFGVRRSGGMYRIAHWKLMQCLQELPQAADEADHGPVDVLSGRRPA